MCRQPLAVALTVRSAVPFWWPAPLDVEEQQSPVRLRIKPITVREQARLGIDNLHKVLSTLVIDPSEATRIVILHIRKALFVRQLMSLVRPLCKLESLVQAACAWGACVARCPWRLMHLRVARFDIELGFFSQDFRLEHVTAPCLS